MREGKPIPPAADSYAAGILRGSSGRQCYSWDPHYWRGFQEGQAMARNDRRGAQRAMADLCALVRANNDSVQIVSD